MHVSVLCWRLLLLLLHTSGVLPCILWHILENNAFNRAATFEHQTPPNPINNITHSCNTYIDLLLFKNVRSQFSIKQFLIRECSMFGVRWKSALTSTLKLHRMWCQRVNAFIENMREKTCRYIHMYVCIENRSQNIIAIVWFCTIIGSMYRVSIMLSSLIGRIIEVVYAVL